MQESYAADYLAVVFAVLAPILLMGAALVIASLVAPKARTGRMSSTYECGMPAVGKNWSQIHIRYFLFAILFLVFDVEAVFLFPWAIIFQQGGIAIFVEMLLFVAILLFGLLYTIKKGVLRWS